MLIPLLKLLWKGTELTYKGVSKLSGPIPYGILTALGAAGVASAIPPMMVL